MHTNCTPTQVEFQGLGARRVEAAFDGGEVTSDAGGVLLREVEARRRIIQGFAGCFQDLRRQDLVEHSVYDMVAQRVYGLALGYEDLIFPDEASLMRLAGAVLLEEHDEWADNRRYISEASMAKLKGRSPIEELERYAAQEAGMPALVL